MHADASHGCDAVQGAPVDAIRTRYTKHRAVLDQPSRQTFAVKHPDVTGTAYTHAGARMQAATPRQWTPRRRSSSS